MKDLFLGGGVLLGCVTFGDVFYGFLLADFVGFC